MIKVAFILTPIDFGGAEKVSLTFLKNVDRNKFSICPIVLVRPWETSNLFIEEIKNASYQYVTIPVALKPLSEEKDYFRVIRCFKILVSLLRKHKCDIIHSNGYFADILGVPAAKIFGIPHVSTCHGYITTDRSLAIYNALDRFFLRFSTKIIAVSDTIKLALVNSGVKEYRIKVIPNAVEGGCEEKFHIKNNRRKIRESLNIHQEEFIVGYVGRLSSEKGVHYLIDSISMLNNADVPLKALIIGEGPQGPELKRLVKDKGIENLFIFAGFQTNIEVWLSVLDAFALPSLTEGTPMALLEAMAFGIPVVATNVGGVPKIIKNKENGLLVNPRDPTALAQAIKTLFQDNLFRKNISDNAAIMIKQKYNIHNWCREIESLYIELT